MQTFLGLPHLARTECSHARLCPTDTGASARAWALRCRGRAARWVERAAIWLLRDGRARAEPCDPHTDLRGPRRNPERFATTQREAASAIRPGPLACPDHRRDRKSDARRPRIGRVPTGMPDGASVRGTITAAPAQGNASVGGGLPSHAARAIRAWRSSPSSPLSWRSSQLS